MGLEEALSSWKIVKWVFFRYRAIALTSVMSEWCATCIIPPLTSASDDELVTKALGLAGRQTENIEAFGVARPEHIAKIMGDQDVHRWITAALSR